MQARVHLRQVVKLPNLEQLWRWRDENQSGQSVNTPAATTYFEEAEWENAPVELGRQRGKGRVPDYTVHVLLYMLV